MFTLVSRSRETVKFPDGLQNASSPAAQRGGLDFQSATPAAALTAEVRRNMGLIEFTILSIGMQIMNSRAFNSLYYSSIGGGWCWFIIMLTTTTVISLLNSDEADIIEIIRMYIGVLILHI